MSISITDNMLKEAVIKADLYLLETLPNEYEIKHEFSNEFAQKMKKLISKSKMGNSLRRILSYRRRKVAYIAAIIILLISVLSVPAARAAVIELITDIYEKFTHIYFDESSLSRDVTAEFIIYEPAYIPEGFELVFRGEEDGLVSLDYEKDDDYISYFQQYKEAASININTEGVELEEFKLNGYPAKYYSNQGVQNLLWYDDTYMFIVSSTLDRDTVIKLAESAIN